MIEIRSALESEAGILSKLAFESKAYWGYSDEFMEACRDELVVSPLDCKNGHVMVACNEENVITGFYSIAGAAPRGELADLFISPEWMGNGFGTLLFKHAKQFAKQLGMDSLEIYSDPHAKDFYLHLGAREIGTVPSGSIPGRELPKLVVDTTS